MPKQVKGIKHDRASKPTIGPFSQSASSSNPFHPGLVIRERRQLLGWKSVDLAKRSGVNPRTVNAIEKGRIQTPSLKNLESISRVLGISLASLFSNSGENNGAAFFSAGQKGHHTLDFKKDGFRVICYTPLVPLVSDVFVGKVIMRSETEVKHETLPTRGMVFAQAIIGRLGLRFDGTEHLIKEGNYVFFDGRFPHTFLNPQLREATFLLVTTPSFLAPDVFHSLVKR